MGETTTATAQEAARNIVQLEVILDLKDMQAGYYLSQDDELTWHLTTEHVPDLRAALEDNRNILFLACGQDLLQMAAFLNQARYFLEKDILHLQ